MLLRRPELAKHVQTIGVYHYEHEWSPIKLNDQDQLMLRTSAENATLDITDLTFAIEDQSIAAYLGLLFNILPNLRELRYRPEYDEDGSIALLLESVTRLEQPRYLEKLETFVIQADAEEYGFSMSDFSPLIRLPSLKTFKGIYTSKVQEQYRDTATGQTMKRDDFPSGSLKVEHLIFRKTALGPDCIAKLFPACKTLKSFDYFTSMVEYEWVQPEPEELIAALQPHKDTLERLLLTDLFTQRFEFLDTETIKYSVGRLTAFSKLRELSIEQALILGIADSERCGDDAEIQGCTHEHIAASCFFCNSEKVISPCPMIDRQNLCLVLPPSLERLCITGCTSQILPHMRELALERAKRFSLLNSITLEISRSEFEEIMSYFSAQEVEGEDDVLVMERLAGNEDERLAWLENGQH
ncbi:hypothetical protein EJ08DRAFT_644483 [Tothia fuscella]|uniref:Uncharacterized protein n=1 Tax=Tothia fuscella TaxID=1048955 RepID=A0A9P4P5E9_9PEZI|nr:hypothetical protein EJ08DRAFT_644483 [Tothia fuscella]